MPIQKALAHFRFNQLDAAPVVDERGRLEGLVEGGRARARVVEPNEPLRDVVAMNSTVWSRDLIVTRSGATRSTSRPMPT
jgi:hypothetical protein